MIVVVDSCVWISAFQFEGVPLLATERVLVHHRLAICASILDEIRKALAKKFAWSQREVNEVFDFYFARAIQVDIPGNILGICRDPKDDMVIECAVAAGADLILTGDKDLLALKRYKSIRILTPRQFLAEFLAQPVA